MSAPAPGVGRYRPVAEALALLLLTFPLAVGFRIPELWFLVPFAVLTFNRRSSATYGLTLRRPGGLGFHAAVIAGVFIPYVLLHYLFEHLRSGAQFHFTLPPSFFASALDPTLMVAFAEEFFFRGYLQTQFDRVYGTPYRLLGAQCGVGLPVAAALFGLCHLTYGAVGLDRFFPGLLYGWLRARTDTIAVPTLYHAASNLLMQIMVASLTP